MAKGTKNKDTAQVRKLREALAREKAKSAALAKERAEALEQQAAAAEILKVISRSPSDVQPVFDAIAARARRLFGAYSATVARRVDDMLHLAAFTATTKSGDAALKKRFPTKLTGEGAVGKAILSRKPAWVADFQTAPGYSARFRREVRERGYRSLLAVPMIRDGEAIGALTVSRKEPGSFDRHRIDLLKIFADQAVIAIENARLFNETKEALERQTATAEVLRVISSSPTDTQPVFEAIAQSGLSLFPGAAVAVVLPAAGQGHAAAIATEEPAQAVAWRSRFPHPLTRDYMHGVALLDHRVVDVPDVAAEVDGPMGLGARNFLASGNKAVTIVPMIRGEHAIGVISVVRAVTGPLKPSQIALLQTFADQAVIAIENVRLFRELEARTEALGKSVQKLTALGEVGQAISSTLDLETVLKTIVSHAVLLTGLDGGAVYEYDEQAELFHLRAAERLSDEQAETLRDAPIRRGDGAVGGTAVTQAPIQIPETHAESYKSPLRELTIRAGRRALLAVPLLREGRVIGALAVQRNTPGPFADETVELLQTFATQSAMAIQNARLFREIAEKGKQLEVASHHKSQFLASMSHELRTPLNALLGFNEMILGEVYGAVPQDMQPPLEQMQASGKHLLRLINNVLDLAKIEAGRMELALSDYSVQDTVEAVRATLRPLAMEKGLEFLASVPADLPLAYGDPGRITQCLMNLAGNSLKFTKVGKVEISVVENDHKLTYRVADTGVGVPPDKMDSLFTEFKQTDATIASEYGGTGLGLSISKKFVEMHGGRIWAESEPGRGSTFAFEIPLRAGEGKAA